MDQKIEALKDYFGADELGDIRDNGDNQLFDTDAGEYLVLTESERSEYLRDSIIETISYFTPAFLSQMTDLKPIVFEKLTDENEAVLALVEATCGLDSFIDEAVDADGAGHFIATWDGVEIELGSGDLFAYRTN